MDLITFKLVSFAVYMESDTGIMGKGPAALWLMWVSLDACGTIEAVRETLAPELHWKLDNYILVWDIDLSPSEDASLDDKVEITERGIKATEFGTAIMKPLPITEKPTEVRRDQGPVKPDKKKVKRAR